MYIHIVPYNFARKFMLSNRNLAGVQVTNVSALNLLLLAPGGHLGRFIIWTQAAFEQLNTIFGTADKPSTVKNGYFLPRPLLTNPDVRRVIQSDSVQALVNAKPTRFQRFKKPNYLKHHKAMLKLNPYAAVVRGRALSVYVSFLLPRLASSLFFLLLSLTPLPRSYPFSPTHFIPTPLFLY